MIAITSDFSKLYNYGENETIRIHVVMHVSTFTHKSVPVKTHLGEGGKVGRWGGRQGPRGYI